MYDQPFVSEAWVVVRDLSNIFFIFILLYIAFQTILGLGGHGGGPKKMIAQVIIMALLINFSMFFTKVIIDSSNILALIFYNKIDIETKITDTDKTKDTRSYIPVIDPAKTGVQDKDLSGGMVSAFDPTRMLSEDFFEKAKNNTQGFKPTAMGAAAFIGGSALAGSVVPIIGTTTGAVVGLGAYTVKSIVGYFFPSDEVPQSLMLGIIVLSGLIMSFAAYAFFISGLSFLGRLVELWILMIFAPFAFMSSIVPKLSHIEGIGWEQWLKRLLSISFMAPIFMFFMYLIFKLVDSKIFASLSDRAFKDQGTIEALVLLMLPALAILILLNKATGYAKKGGGKLGEMALGAAKIVGGAAGGVALGLTATAGRATLGRAGGAIAKSEWAKGLETFEGGNMVTRALTQFAGARIRDTGKAFGTGSLDVRGIKIAGQSLASATGLKLGEAQKGGFEQTRKEQVESRQKRAKELEVGEDEELKQELNELEEQKQGLLREVSHDIEQLDNRIKVWRERASDAARAVRGGFGGNNSSVFDNTLGRLLTNTEVAGRSETNLEELKAHRNAIKDGRDFNPTNASAINPGQVGVVQNYSTRTRVGGVATGASINDLEDTLIPEAHHNIEIEDRRRKWAFADATQGALGQTVRMIFKAGEHSVGGAREAAHKIRMEAKLDSGEKTH